VIEKIKTIGGLGKRRSWINSELFKKIGLLSNNWVYPKSSFQKNNLPRKKCINVCTDSWMHRGQEDYAASASSPLSCIVNRHPYRSGDR